MLLGFIITATLIFVPAGTICFFNGWLLITALFVPMTVIGIVLMIGNPTLLKKRINSKEKLKKQSLIVKLSAVMFILGFVIAGIDYRLDIVKLPNLVIIIASIIFLVSYILYILVLNGFY